MKKVYVPAEISVEIEMAEYRKYKLNVAKAFFDQSTFIPPNYKRKLKGRILVTGPGKTTKSGSAEIRITGDYTDHIRIKDVVSSLHVKLLDDHLSGIRVFKLLLPGTRFGYHEIFATTFLEELGFIAPYTRMVDINLNGYHTKMLFQEVPAKELLERYSLREAPIIEGDERQYYRNVIHGGGRHVCCTGRLDNGKWLVQGSESRELIVANALSSFTEVVMRGDEDQQNTHHHKFTLEDTSYDELTLFLTATHGQSAHNRKLYYDPMYDRLRPIYYDGDPELLGTHIIRPERLSEEVREKIVEDEFIEKVMAEFKRRAGPLDEETVTALETLEGRSFVRQATLVQMLQQLVATVKAFDPEKTVGVRRSESEQSFHNQRLPAPMKKFNALSPYLFVSRDPSNGQALMCVVHPSVTSKALINYTFDTTREFTCNPIDDKTFHEALKGNRSVKSAEPPYRLFIHTPGTVYINGVTATSQASSEFQQQVATSDKVKLVGFGSSGIYDAVTNAFAVRRNKSKQKRYKFAELEAPRIVNVDANSTHFIFFDSTGSKNTHSSLELRLSRTGHDIGRVVLIGDASELKSLTVVGIETPAHAQPADAPELFDDRLLTGCVTFLDAKVSNLSIEASNLHCEDMVNFVRTTGNVRRLQLTDGSFDGLDVDFSRLDFEDVVIEAAGNDCADFSAGHYSIRNLRASSCKDKGISVGEMSTVQVERAFIDDAIIGIASKDGSKTIVERAYMKNVKNCFSAYRKKQEFDGGKITYHSLEGNCTTMVETDKLSSVVKYD